MTPEQRAQDEADRARAEKLARRGLDMLEALLDGRAAIVVQREMLNAAERTGAPDLYSMPEPIFGTVIRLRMDT